MKKIISFIAITALLFACSKTDITSTENSEAEATEKAKGGHGGGNGGGGGPTLIVTTDEASYILPFGAICGGEVSKSGGGDKVTERGVCYSTSENPTIDDDTVASGSGSGTFTSILSWLNNGTTYYVRAYANKSKKGTITTTYGNEVSFTTPEPIYGTVDDIDGNTYTTIEIGTQVWMMENLKTTKYRDGTHIPNVTSDSEWNTTSAGAYCDYDNNPDNSIVYGRLYNSWAASNPLIAPDGWHVPSLGEFFTLTNYLGVEFAGGRMKEAGFTHWSSPNTGADNSSDFTAVGAGMRQYLGSFQSLGEKNNFWTSWIGYQLFLLDHDSGSYHYAEGSGPDDSLLRYGCSIRLVKD